MALVLADRVQETTTTSGTGTLTLSGAVSGYITFATGVGAGNTTYYCIYDQTAQVWEIGLGTVGSGSFSRDTVYSNSSGTTSKINLAGNTASVFAVYTASKTVNLDASGNVTALGNVTSATWQGTTVGVAYGGTGVTASSGANSVVLRDANQNIAVNSVTQNLTKTTSAAGTTTLTLASSHFQILTGTTTQTYKLPDATSLPVGTIYVFDNDSTDNLTVQDNALGTVDVVAPGGYSTVFLEANGTVAGEWGRFGMIPNEVNWGTNSLALGGSTIVSGGTWQGNTIQPGYGGTGLTSLTSGGALYATSSSTMTSGTLPVTAGGTGQTSFSSGYIPYGNSSAALQSSASLQFNGTYLVVGGTTPLGGTTNPITAFSSTANNYVQTYVYNASSGSSASADFVAYADNSTDAHGWADIGYTSSTYNDASYSVTGPNEAYVLGSAPANASATGNLVYATDSTGSANAHQWYVGGFNQAKGAWKMQLTSTGLQLASALGTAYGGTGLTTVGTNGQVLTSNGTTLTWSTPATAVTSVTGTSPVVSSGGTTPAISLASGYGDTKNPYGSKTANYFLASPNGSAGTPGFRGIVAADIPTLNQNTTGQAGSVANAVTFNNSGTGGASGSNFNGATAFTVSYNTIGASPLAGSTSITTLGTIGTGVWQGSSIATTYTAAKVTDIQAGTGIGVSATTGSVTVTNNGVTGLTGGNGISVSGSTGSVTITSTGATLNSQAGAYVLVASDAGKIVSNTTGGVTINNSVMSAGNIVTIYNNSGSSQTITQGTGVTLQWAGQSSSTTGNRTLGLYGIATVFFISASTAVITGSGLT